MKFFRNRALLTGMLLLLVGAQAFGQAKGIEKKKEEAKVLIDAQVGYTSYYNVVKPEYWYPVWVTIKPQAFDLRGRVSIRQPENELRVEAPVQIPKGVAQRFLMYYRFEEMRPMELVVTIEARRLGREEFAVQLRWAATGEQHVLVLAEKPGGFSFLNRQPVESRDDPNAGAQSGPNRQARRAQLSGSVQPTPYVDAYGGTAVAYGDIALLPEHAVALAALDAIVINTPGLRDLSEQQWGALQAWMGEGGRLLLAGGRYQPFIEQSQMKDVFGMAPGTGGQVELTATNAQDTATTGALKAVASLPANPGEIRLTAGGMPLISGRRVGRGWFYYSAVALDPSVLDWIGATRDAQGFWLPLLERHWTETPLEGLWRGSDEQIAAQLEQSFNYKLAGAGWFFNFIGLYILLVLPINWYVCRKIGHREWTWPVAVVLALMFSAYAYSSGLSRQGKQMAASELTVMRKIEDLDVMRVKTWNAVYSPRRFTAAFDVPAAAFPYVPPTMVDFRFQRPGRGEELFADRPLTVMYGGGGPRINDLFFYNWSTRRLAAEYDAPAEGKLEVAQAVIRDANGKLSGIVRNGTPWTFRFWAISDGRAVWASEAPLEAGAEGDALTLNLAPEMVLLHVFRRLGELAKGHAGALQTNGFYSGFDADEMQYIPTGTGDPRRQEWFFVGIAEEAVSPVVGAMDTASRLGLLVFEQSLASERIGEANQTGEPHWVIREKVTEKPVDDEQMQYYGYPQPRRPEGLASAATDNFLFGQRLTDIRLVPDREILTGAWGAATVSFKIDSHPQRDQAYNLQESHRNPQGRGPLAAKWKIGTCPTSVYNWKTSKWEAFSPGGRLAPIEQYLEPATQSISLRLYADREHFLYAPADAQEPSIESMRTVSSLWQEPYMQGEQHVYQLLDLDVKLEPVGQSNEGAER